MSTAKDRRDETHRTLERVRTLKTANAAGEPVDLAEVEQLENHTDPQAGDLGRPLRTIEIVPNEIPVPDSVPELEPDGEPTETPSEAPVEVER